MTTVKTFDDHFREAQAKAKMRSERSKAAAATRKKQKVDAAAKRIESLGSTPEERKAALRKEMQERWKRSEAATQQRASSVAKVRANAAKSAAITLKEKRKQQRLPELREIVGQIKNASVDEAVEILYACLTNPKQKRTKAK